MKASLGLQYRGQKSDELAKKVRKFGVSVVFTTRKLKTALPSLKSAIPKLLQSHVVYHITCSSCNASYVGQTARHLTTRLKEHSRPSTNVGSHLATFETTMENAEVKILDKSPNLNKLLTLEALYITSKTPTINLKEEYRSRELTLRL